MNLSAMNYDELLLQSAKPETELSKDTVLEKLILYVVANFCIGTELRFLASK